jgi:hypothetical protein
MLSNILKPQHMSWCVLTVPTTPLPSSIKKLAKVILVITANNLRPERYWCRSMEFSSLTEFSIVVDELFAIWFSETPELGEAKTSFSDCDILKISMTLGD